MGGEVLFWGLGLEMFKEVGDGMIWGSRMFKGVPSVPEAVNVSAGSDAGITSAVSADEPVLSVPSFAVHGALRSQRSAAAHRGSS